MSFAICFVKGICADTVAQQLSDRARFDVRRCLAFGIYAGAYQGCAQYFILNVVFGRLFGHGTGLRVVVTKVFAENFVHAPLLCIPAYYLMKAVVFGQGPRAGLSEYLSDVREQGLLQRYWMVWLPAQCVTFGLVPEHLRIAFVAAISFFWLMILSATSAAGARARRGQGAPAGATEADPPEAE